METTATASNWHLQRVFSESSVVFCGHVPPCKYILDVGSLGTLRLEVDVLPETKM